MSANEPTEQRFWRIGNPVLWGIGFSSVLVGAFAWMFSLEDCGLTSCETKWHKFIASSPNEMGDALAGLAGALAFLWIIVTVMLQSQELREQRKEMRLQRDEFEKMGKAQKLQAKILKRQADIFRDEQRQRTEERKDSECDALLDELRSKFLTMNGIAWLEGKTLGNEDAQWEKTGYSLSFTGPQLQGLKLESYYQKIATSLEIFSKIYKQTGIEGLREVRMKNNDLLDQAINIITKIRKISPDLSDANKSKMRRIHFKQLDEGLSQILKETGSKKDDKNSRPEL